MPGPEGLGDIAVVLAALIGVADQQGNRRAGGAVLVHTGQDLDLVGLLALRHVARGARLAAVEFELDVSHVQRHAGGAAVDHAADGGTMGLAEGGDGKEGTQGITGHDSICSAKNGILPRVAQFSNLGAGGIRHGASQPMRGGLAPTPGARSTPGSA